MEGEWGGNGRGEEGGNEGTMQGEMVEGRKGRKEGSVRGGGGKWGGCQFRVAQTTSMCLPTCEDFRFAIQLEVGSCGREIVAVPQQN